MHKFAQKLSEDGESGKQNFKGNFLLKSMTLNKLSNNPIQEQNILIK